MSMYENLSHQEIARQHHAQLIQNATIRYAAKVSYEPKTPPTPEPQHRRVGAFVSLFRRAALAGS